MSGDGGSSGVSSRPTDGTDPSAPAHDRAGSAAPSPDPDAAASSVTALDNGLVDLDFAIATADWIWQTDVDHRFVQPDGEAANSIGEHYKTFEGRTRWDVLGVDPETDPRWYQHREVLMRHLPFRDFRYTFRKEGHAPRSVRISGVPLFTADGTFRGYRGTAIDESIIHDAAERADAAEYQLREAVDAMDQGFALFDADDRLIVWSRSLQEILSGLGAQLRQGFHRRTIWALLSITSPLDDPECPTDAGTARGEREVGIGDRWYQVREQLAGQNQRVMVWSEITELKRQQTALEESREALENRVRSRTRSLADTTERLRALIEEQSNVEERLRESERQFRHVVEGSIQGICVIRNQKVLFANPAFVRLFAYPSVQAIKDLADSVLLVSPEFREEVLHASATANRTPYRSEVRYLRADGTTFWGERFGSIIEWLGGPALMLAIVDIEERKRAEQEYRDIFEHATEGIYRSTPEGRQLRANPALVALNGYDTEEEMLADVNDIGQKWYVDPGRRAEFVRLMERDGRVTDFVSEVYRFKTRERVWVSENAFRVSDVDGQTSYYQGTVRDITTERRIRSELIAAKNEAERASHAKSQFLAKMSHELRTPLNAIIGFSDLIVGEVFGPVGAAKYLEYAGDIKMSGQHLLDLINDLLDLAKIEAGAFELREERVALRDEIAAICEIMAPAARGRDVQLEVVALDDMPVLQADRRAVRQMLVNLISNGIKFNVRGGRLTVSLVDRSPDIALAITDTGPGIALEEMDRILSPFGQLKNEMVATEEGTGLGLPIVRSLIELHGGRLEISSGVGKGTSAILVFPPDRLMT